MKAGKITEVQCKRSVLKLLPKVGKQVVQGAGIGHDYGAVRLENPNQIVTAIATCSFATQASEKYAFWKALNKLETSGASAVAIMVNILLPARGNEKRIKEITGNLAELCTRYQLEYLGGHTELMEELRTSVITVIAYGSKTEQEPDYSIHYVTPGESILMVGYAAMETTVMLTNDKWEELNTRYTAGYLEGARAMEKELSLHQTFQALRTEPVTYIHDISTGGVFAALWEIGEGAGCGLDVYLKSIPIRQETIEVCEFFDINPYMALSGGSALIVTSRPEPVMDTLQQMGISVRMIGQITDRNDRIVINEDDIRYLTPPKGDDIYKIYRN